MWIVQWLFLLKVATINSALKFVMDSSIIVLSYNNLVPWLSFISIDIYFERFVYGCEV